MFFLPVSCPFATVLDFEDLYESAPFNKKLSVDYQGFIWSGNVWAVTDDTAAQYPWNDGVIGNVGIFGGYDFGTYPIQLKTIQACGFDFNGAYITSANAGRVTWVPDSFYVAVEGWKDGVLVYSESVTVTDALTKFIFEYSGIDTLWFIPQDESQIIIDDLQYSMATVNPVPEASSMVFVLWGILIFLFSKLVCRKIAGY
jgi:hypothetical protein